MAKYTSTELAALRAAIASGALSVQYTDRSVTYRSLDDMLKVERIMAADIEGSQEDRFSVTAYSRD